MNRSVVKAIVVPARTACLVASGAFAITTKQSLQDFPGGLDVAREGVVKPAVLARDGTRLSVSLQNAWNTTDVVPLQEMPQFLQRAFIVSEDKTFYEHRGVDWSARLAAVWQNATNGEAVRGASTITEQVVRMLHPRPRTLWSRWLEGFEAQRLEARFSKAEILAFYLNQVPCTDRRRGVVQAARYYYDRDLETLTRAETLSLVVLVRSPQGMDPRKNPTRLAGDESPRGSAGAHRRSRRGGSRKHARCASAFCECASQARCESLREAGAPASSRSLGAPAHDPGRLGAG